MIKRRKLAIVALIEEMVITLASSFFLYRLTDPRWLGDEIRAIFVATVLLLGLLGLLGSLMNAWAAWHGGIRTRKFRALALFFMGLSAIVLVVTLASSYVGFLHIAVLYLFLAVILFSIQQVHLRRFAAEALHSLSSSP